MPSSTAEEKWRASSYGQREKMLIDAGFLFVTAVRYSFSYWLALPQAVRDRLHQLEEEGPDAA